MSLRRLPRLLLMTLMLMLVVIATPTPAFAQSADVTCSLNKRRVRVGEMFAVSLRAMVDNGATPQRPTLRTSNAFAASGPQVSTRTFAQLGGGQSLIQRGIGATWRVRALREGTFTIPSPTVMISGRKVAAVGRLTITVGSGGSTSTPTAPDFDDPLPSDFIDDALNAAGQRLALTSAPDRYAFVRIVADKTDVVVGEQVTLSYYFYRYSRYSQIGPAREPALTDFLRFPLDRVPGIGGSVTTKAGDRVFEARLIDQVAVFPLRAGKINTGTLELDFTGRSFRNALQTRRSNDLVLNVRPPPKKGRPVGYRIGDTGRYEISAKVTPRTAKVGDTVAVEVVLSGVGAVPSSVRVPERSGVEWLTPEKHETSYSRRGKIGGTRTFRYAVRMSKPGIIELGAVSLPHWDPDTRRYRAATAPLGQVRVTQSKRAAQNGSGGGSTSQQDDDEDGFAAIAGPRKKMRAYAGLGDRGLSPVWLWSLVLVPPFMVVFGGALARGAGGVKQRLRARADDPGVQARQALGEINAKGDPKDIAAGCERAVHLAIEAATGLKSRAILLGVLPQRLTDAGVDEGLTEDSCGLLQDCSALRFEPDADAGSANALLGRAKKVVKQLLKASKKIMASASDAADES